jgi:hypothetical protein
MLSWLLEIVEDPDKRAVISWVCGGIAAAGAGVWAVVKFLSERNAERKKAGEKKDGDTNITLSGQGLALRDKTTFNAPVTIAPNSGPSPQHIEQIQKPLADELTAQRALFAGGAAPKRLRGR